MIGFVVKVPFAVSVAVSETLSVVGVVLSPVFSVMVLLEERNHN